MTSLRARLLAAVTYVLVLAILAFGVPLALNLRARVNAEVRTQAQAQADLVAATAADLLAPGARAQLATLARTAARSLRGRVLVVDRSGNVLVDSGGPGEVGVSYESRPELERALTGHPVQIERASRTLGQEILATAVPIIHNGRTAGAVRVTQSVAAVTAAVRRIEFALAVTGLVVLALGLAAGQFLASQIARPLHRLQAAARRVAEGDLAARAPVQGSREQRSLSRSFNEMTTRIARLLAAQRDFVADASHQLRTPLTGLRLRLEEARAMTAERHVVAELDAAIGEVDRLAHRSTSCSCSPVPVGAGRPGPPSISEPSPPMPSGGGRRAPRSDGSCSAPTGAGRPGRCGRRGPMSNAPSMPWWKTRWGIRPRGRPCLS